MVSKKSVGIKNDKDKLRIDLITPEMITALAKVLKYGASEYGERNFEKGIDFSRENGQLHKGIYGHGGTGKILMKAGLSICGMPLVP